jgi:hypothetical protein
VVAILGLTLWASAGELDLEWDPSDDATGYTVHWGPNPAQYTDFLDVGNVTVTTLGGLPDCVPTYIAVTASNDAGNSDHSNEIVSFEDADGDGVQGLCDHFPNDGERSGPLHVGTVESLDHLWQTVAFPTEYQDPIVIVGPPTLNGSDPGVIRIDNVTGSSFDIQFQEWRYLDSIHAKSESVSYLVMERGRYVMGDGSIWEIGTFPLGGNGVLQPQSFTQAFPSAPALLLTVQSLAGAQPVTIRAKGVSSSGFQAALFEEEALMGTDHYTEEVGYLAVHSDLDSGTVTVDGLTTLPYALLSTEIGSQFAPVLTWNVKAQEEQSLDPETSHLDEPISVLALGRHFFAQDVGTLGLNTMTLRRIDPEVGRPMEWGMIDGVTRRWMTVPLANSYVDPVVIVKPLSGDGGVPAVTRLRNVGNDSFEIHLRPWFYLNGTGSRERVFYMVSESGQHDLAGLTVEAGKVDTDATMVNNTWAPVAFSAPFSATPAVFSQVQTYNGDQPVVTRNSGRNISGFSLCMDEEEGLDGWHTVETVGWVAIEPGMGQTTGGRAIEVFTTLADSDLTPLTFLQSYTGRKHPSVIADIASSYDVDPCGPRLASVDSSGAELFLEEEQSDDAEVEHAPEDVSVLVAE